MLKTRRYTGNKAQSLLEYSVVVGAVIMVMIAMSTLIKRGTQGMIRVVSDQVGNQVNAEQRFDDRGHLENAYTSSRSTRAKTTDEYIGNIIYGYDETIVTEEKTISNLGYTNLN